MTGPTYGAIEVNEHIIGVQQAIQEPSHIVRNNILHDVESAIRAGTSCKVYNNIIWNAADYGIYVDNKAGDNWDRLIYHNTIDLSGSSSVHVASSASNQADVRNNIGPSDNIVSDSSYFVGGDDYHLVDGATPIDAGVSLGAEFLLDFEENTRNSQPDMGAYEYTGECTPMTLSDLISVIDQWKLGETSLNEVMQAIVEWKNGC